MENTFDVNPVRRHALSRSRTSSKFTLTLLAYYKRNVTPASFIHNLSFVHAQKNFDKLKMLNFIARLKRSEYVGTSASLKGYLFSKPFCQYIWKGSTMRESSEKPRTQICSVRNQT